MSEVRTPLDQFLVRLRELGATSDEIDAVAATWDLLDPDDDPDPLAWTRARRTYLSIAPDPELRAIILAGRDEYEHGTTSEEDAAAADLTRRERAAAYEASGRVGGTIAAIMAWVASDPVRAAAVLDLETQPGGSNRKTLTVALRDIVKDD